MSVQRSSALYNRISGIIESVRMGVARSVNTAQVVSNWLIGREIVEDEQKGYRRAEYGKHVIEILSRRLIYKFGRGFTVRNLETFRVLYLEYSGLLIPHAVRAELKRADPSQALCLPPKRSAALNTIPTPLNANFIFICATFTWFIRKKRRSSRRRLDNCRPEILKHETRTNGARNRQEPE